MKLPHRAAALSLLATSFLLLAGCSNGGSGPGTPRAEVVELFTEFEPNDDFSSAAFLEPGIGGTGDVIALGDIDMWTFLAEEGQVIQIELQAIILDPEGWTAECTAPVLEIYGPDELLIVEHDPQQINTGPQHDLDFPHFMITESGPHTIAVRNVSIDEAGGRYAVRWRPVELSNLQFELEPRDVSGNNDAPGNAEPIAPGTLWGHLGEDDFDVYSFTIEGTTRIDLEVEAQRSGRLAGENEYAPVFLEVLDANFSSIFFETNNVFQDAELSVVLSDPGTYFVRVMPQSGSRGEYYLHYENTAVGEATLLGGATIDTATPIGYGQLVHGTGNSMEQFFAFDAQAGDLIELETYRPGDTYPTSSGFLDTTIFQPDSASLPQQFGRYSQRALIREGGRYLLNTFASGSDRFAFRLKLVRRSIYQTEFAAALSGAPPLAEVGARSGSIQMNEQRDRYRFTAQEGTLLSFTIYAEVPDSHGYRERGGFSSTLSPILRILDRAGNVLVESNRLDCAVGVRSTNALGTLELAFAAEVTDTYYVEVAASNGESSTHTYLIEQTRADR